jgi:Tol biopolymer transport system component
MSSEGGEARRITEHPAPDFFPLWSEDGEELIFSSVRDGVPKLWRIPLEGGEPEPLTEGAAWFPRWSRDGNWIFFTGFADRAGNIWAVSKGGKEIPLTDFRGRRGSLGSFALAADEMYLYFTWEEDLGDLWITDVESR